MSLSESNSYLGNLQSINASRQQNALSSIRQLEEGKISQKADFAKKQNKAMGTVGALQEEIGISPDAVTGARSVIKLGKNIKDVGSASRTATALRGISAGATPAASEGGKFVQGALDVKEGLSSGSNIGKALTLTKDVLPGVDEAVEGASLASKALSGLGGAAAIATGGLAAGKDIEGLIDGKGLASFGANDAEKVANASEIVGSALSFVPGGEVIGGLIAGVGGIINFFGEKEETHDKEVAKQKADKAIDSEVASIASSGPRSAGMASLGMISNMSKTADVMSSGSGAF